MRTSHGNATAGGEWFRAANEHDIPSPALLLFLERIDENLAAMVRIAGSPARLRPHIKTHKLPQLIERQIALGITRFKCATVAEAEMALEAGAPDVLLAYPLVGPNPQRLAALQTRYPEARISAIADSEEGIRALSAAALGAGVSIGTYLDLDCGMHRTGVTADSPHAAALYRMVEQSPGLIAAGLHAYDGHIHDTDLAERTAKCDAAFQPVERLREQLLSQGSSVPALIAGGTPTFAIHAAHPARELSPGTCVLWDFGYGDKLPDLPFLPAAVLLTRVVSKPGRNRLCLDLGHKAVASESPQPRVRLLELPSSEAVVHSEEHLVVETPDSDRFAVGTVLHGIPRHVCPTVALYDSVWPVENSAAGSAWKVEGRARRLSV
jgi:D-serine deaminase-like pyridoxal phosphate-dependent protein